MKRKHYISISLPAVARRRVCAKGLLLLPTHVVVHLSGDGSETYTGRCTAKHGRTATVELSKVSDHLLTAHAVSTFA